MTGAARIVGSTMDDLTMDIVLDGRNWENRFHTKLHRDRDVVNRQSCWKYSITNFYVNFSKGSKWIKGSRGPF